MPNSKARYQSYILRFWQENEDAPWRARLESIGNQAGVKHFADAKPLLDLLNPTVTEKEGSHEPDKS